MTESRTTAVAATAPGDVDAPSSFVEIELDLPALPPRELLVDVRAVSVNPADHKLRQSFDPADAPKVLGYDAAGVVVGVGSEVTSFAVGDEVFYSGSSLQRPGSNATLQQVQERVVARKPASLDFAQAAALPLTAGTAWECLFDRLGVEPDGEGTLLVVGGAGGVGSMIVQLARALTRLTVIATGGRTESARWAKELGAHHVVDHHDLLEAVRAVAPRGVDFVVSAHSPGNVETYAELLPVHGAVVAIDDPVGLDTMPLKRKSQTWHWEFLYSRSESSETDDHQQWVLQQVADLVDIGRLRSTMTTRLSPIDAETLRRAHRLVESGDMVGKVVISRD